MFAKAILLAQQKGYLEPSKALLSSSVGFELADQDQLWASDKKVDPLI